MNLWCVWVGGKFRLWRRKKKKKKKFALEQNTKAQRGSRGIVLLL
jgi:hypothetical protein